MAIITGGVIGEHGEPGRALKSVMLRVRGFAPRSSVDEYAVDLGFFSWSPGLGPPPPGAPDAPGVTPWMVGRKQRRFVVKLGVPPGLANEAEVTGRLISCLPEVARLCREYLPAKSGQYPAERLAQEIEALAASLAD